MTQLRNLLMTAALVLLVGPAFAQELSPPPPSFTWTGISVGAQIGSAWGTDKLTESTAIVPPQTGIANSTFSSIVGGAHAGYHWQFSNVVVGAEGDMEGSGLRKNDTCLVQEAGVGNVAPGVCFPQGGFNYNFTTRLPWQASLRVRLGYAWGNALLYATGGLAIAAINTSYTTGTGFLTGSQSFSHTQLGPTVGAGFEYAFNPGWTARLEYRFSDFGTVTDNVTSGGAFFNGYADHHRVRQHAVRIGVSYWFNAPPPAPEPTATPAPAAARSYLVFFDWDKATLTPRAQQIIKEAADNSTRQAYTKIEVNGYTDTSGTAQYNQGLSVRRAQAVAAELVRDGVPKNAISIQGFGETRLLVPTGSGVREPQNRRVEIIIR